MKTWMLLAFLALGAGSVFAHDPPGYPRALIGRVMNIMPDGLVVQGVNLDQIHLQSVPGENHACFAALGGPSFVRGVKTSYRIGDPIEIMVTEGDDTYVLGPNTTQPMQLGTWNFLSSTLAFGVDVDWDPSHPSSGAASTPPTPPSHPSQPSAGGSIDDPVPGAPK